MTTNNAIAIINECNDVMDEAKKLGYGYNLDGVKESLERLEALGMKWGDKLQIHRDFRLRKGEVYITNPTTHYEFKNDTWYIVWDNGNVGAYQFVNGDKAYCAVRDEYREFKEKLMSYNPVDYDLHNDHIIYDIENGKKLMADYAGIVQETRDKMQSKIKAVALAEAKEKYEKLLAEQM